MSITPNLGLRINGPMGWNGLDDSWDVDSNFQKLDAAAGGSAFLFASGVLTSAQILEMGNGSSPQLVLIPAAGEGLAILPVLLVANYIFKTTPYTIGDPDTDNIVIGPIDPDHTVQGFGLGLVGFLDQPQSALQASPGFLSGTISAIFQNSPLTIRIAGDTPTLTNGDGTVEWNMIYVTRAVK